MNTNREIVFIGASFALGASLLLVQRFVWWIQLIYLVGGTLALFAIVLIEDHFRNQQENQQENQQRHHQILNFIEKCKLGDKLIVDELPYQEWWTISTRLLTRRGEDIEEATCASKYDKYRAKIVINNGIVIKIVK